MGKVTELSQGNLNGLHNEVCSCIDNAFRKGRQVGWKEANNEKVLLVRELRKVREGITDEKVLIGFNMAIAICNKYLGEENGRENRP